MPVVPSSYKRPYYLLNGHLETIIPSVFFNVKDKLYQRERLELSDGDFLDIDWIQKNHNRCVVITHGLEGDSGRYYVKRTAKYFSEQGWDIAAWNCRSCSGELNRLPRFYHHGDTPDLDSVVKEVLSKGYLQVFLIGYSMGGSMTLKYLGEQSQDIRILGASVYSVPCNLRDSAIQLKVRENRFYERRFLKKLQIKIKLKAELHPADVSAKGIDELVDFDEFHERYTAPLHGYLNKEDFFQQATCDQFLHQIDRPVLIVNAKNDPMLGEACYPFDAASKNTNITLEVPIKGGHVGFTLNRKGPSYMEVRASQFLKEKFEL